MDQVLEETAENRESIRLLKDESMKHGNDIKSLFGLTSGLRDDVTIIEEKLVVS